MTSGSTQSGDWAWWAVACLLLGIYAPAAASEAEKSESGARPNIVLILCDDMGFSDIGCYGGEIQTPHLDRLAREGLRFRQFYNNAKCTTTRASLMTGRYPRHGGRGMQLLDERTTTIAEELSAVGYRTSLSGKWHLGQEAPHRPIDRGFDEFYGLLDGCCNFFDPSQPDPEYKGGRVRVFAHNDQRITSFPDDYYTTDAFTDHAIGMMREFAGGDAPFFLHVTYTAPHYPLHAKPEHIARYLGNYRDGWEALRRTRYERMVRMGIIDESWPLSDTDSRSYSWEEADQEFEDRRMAVYAAMIHSMDENIGRLMTEVDRLGLDRNTLVMFLSDNGGCAEEPGGRDPAERFAGPVDDYVAVGPAWGWAQNTPFRRYKQWVHEGGISTPMIARWPGRIAHGSMTNDVGHIIDLLPTFAELAGGRDRELAGDDNQYPIEGISLVPVLEGATRVGHDELCWHWSGNRAIRRGPWKLVWDKRVKTWELYDVVADRTEMRNLADEMPEKVEAMAAGWDTWARKTGVVE